jgi:ABC-type transporter Mla subunit MlaD
MKDMLARAWIALLAEPWVMVAAGALLLFALIVYWVWFRQAFVEAEEALAALKKKIQASPRDWPGLQHAMAAEPSKHPGVALAWKQTELRVVKLPGRSGGSVPFFLSEPRDQWTVQRVLGARFNLHLAEAVPNLLVGVGLLLTFFFLSLALLDATAALVGTSKGQTNILDATRGLLSSAGGKFLTSLAGLLASIVWTLASRRRITHLGRASDSVVEALLERVTADGAEAAVSRQLELAMEALPIANDQLQLAKQSQEVRLSQLGVTEELLLEAREQSGSLKRFETDLAVTIGKAVTEAFSPQMQAMTERMVQAIEGLSERIGSMNEEALERMLTNFSGSLKAASAEEMEAFKKSLDDLTTRLAGAGTEIGTSVAEATGNLNQATFDMAEKLSHISAQFEANASGLASAVSGMQAAAGAFEGVLQQAQAAGSQGVGVFKGALHEANSSIEEMRSVSQSWNDSVRLMNHSATEIQSRLESAEVLMRTQRAVIDAVRQATPQALEAVNRVTEILGEAHKEVSSSMNRTRENLESATSALNQTVDKITEGVSGYSDQVAELHRKMDGQLGRAVGSFDKAVSSLEEAIEELGETLGARTE